MRLPRPRTLDVVRERDLRVPMDDGVVLLADRLVARSLIGRPQPTVLVRSPYGRGGLVGLAFGRLLAERGLQVVVQSVRGTFGSGGTFSPFDERPDGLATLRWLRAQPWHAGPIGTIGPSYLGLVQWAIATEGDLAAMSVHATASQFHGQTFAGGGLALENVGTWMAVVEAQRRWPAPLAVARAVRRVPARLDTLPLSELDRRLTGSTVPWFQAAAPRTDRPDPYWVARDFQAGVASVSAAVQFIGGWYDILLPWMLADFAAMRDAGRRPELLIGPWAHTSPGMLAAGVREGLSWLRAHLLGEMRPGARAAVRLAITGAGGPVWRSMDRWPPPSRPLQLFARAGGLLCEAPAADDGDGDADHYRYDPLDPTPSLGGPVLLARDPVLDNAPLEARPDVLTYTGPVLPRTLEAIGEPAVRLWLRTTRPHFDVFARICDVDRAGVSRNVCDALLRVDPASADRRPDGSVRVTFALWPIAHAFAAGHRIRLLVCSGAHPRYARNPGSGCDPMTATAADMLPVEVALLRDSSHPSSVTLPVVAGR